MISVLSPGARTLVQDAGRHGYEHLGVPTSGAADLPALRLANRLVANNDDTPAFEIAAHGPALRFESPAVVAYTGTETTLHLDGRPVPTHHTIRIRPGQVLTIDTLRGGVFGYLAVSGGFDVAPTLGSASSCTMSGLGPAALAAGDTIHLAAPGREVPDGFVAAPRTQRTALRLLPGPHAHLFTPEAMEQFLCAAWTVSMLSSRVGVRLDGPALAVPDTSLPSMGMVTGAVQVPPSGTPIVLGPDHGTVGGYPVIAVVHSDDMPALMQRPAGLPVAFTASGSSTATPAEATSTLVAVVRHHRLAALSA